MSEPIAPATPHRPADLVAVQPGAIVSRQIARTDHGNVTLFAFDAGQQLSEHTSPYDAWVHVVEGEAELVIGGETVPCRAGEIVLMPAGVPHAVVARVPFKMLLVMLKG